MCLGRYPIARHVGRFDYHLCDVGQSLLVFKYIREVDLEIVM